MTFAGIAISRVGLKPRHSVKKPSFRAIFLSPSKVELNVLRCVSSTAQSAMAVAAGTAPFPLAKQNCALSPTQNTSRQHAVIPRSGGSFLNELEYAWNFERLRGENCGA